MQPNPRSLTDILDKLHSCKRDDVIAIEIASRLIGGQFHDAAGSIEHVP